MSDLPIYKTSSVASLNGRVFGLPGLFGWLGTWSENASGFVFEMHLLNHEPRSKR